MTVMVVVFAEVLPKTYAILAPEITPCAPPARCVF